MRVYISVDGAGIYTTNKYVRVCILRLRRIKKNARKWNFDLNSHIYSFKNSLLENA